jgi:gas vesicle protein
MKNGKAILGILAGVAAGTAIGILIAPHKGWRTRKFIKRGADQLADLVKERMEERLEDVYKGLGLPECKHNDKSEQRVKVNQL